MSTLQLLVVAAERVSDGPGVVAFLVGLVIAGAIVGGLGRLLLPGPDPMSIPMTIGVGIAGSFIAGIAVALLSGGEAVAGLLASVLGAMFVVWLVRRSRSGSETAV